MFEFYVKFCCHTIKNPTCSTRTIIEVFVAKCLDIADTSVHVPEAGSMMISRGESDANLENPHRDSTQRLSLTFSLSTERFLRVLSLRRKNSSGRYNGFGSETLTLHQSLDIKLFLSSLNLTIIILILIISP